jgi:uracil-DNA glycosylase
MDLLIDHFIDRLAQARPDGPVFNPYWTSAAGSTLREANHIRQQNLRLYLQAMAAAQPRLALIGEAPGYRGCRLTGVPFTSESILLDRQIWPFGRRQGFRRTTERAEVAKETTASLIWSAVKDWRPPPLLWNAFPFHPHRDGRPDSNRKPRAAELHLGAGFLVEILGLFQPDIVAAVGRSAARALDYAGLPGYATLRHPSRGGKVAFLAGLNQIHPSEQEQ